MVVFVHFLMQEKPNERNVCELELLVFDFFRIIIPNREYPGVHHREVLEVRIRMLE